MNKIPNFFIIGAPNSGTTSLWYILKQHPDIYLPEVKEPRFFSRDDYKNNFNWYLSLYYDITTEKAIGEASVNYCETHLFENTPENIYRFNTHSKIIYVVRDPIARISSCWRQALSSGHWYKYFYYKDMMSLDIKDAIFNYPHFLKTTLYYKNLSLYKKYFSDEQIHVVLFEDFINDPIVVIKDIFNFLDIQTSYKPHNIRKPLNKGSTKNMRHPILKYVSSILSQLVWDSKTHNKIINKIEKHFPMVEQKPFNLDYNTYNKFICNIKDDAINMLNYCNKPISTWTLY